MVEHAGLDLEQHRLQTTLDSLYLVQEYISPEVEQQLLTEIRASKAAWRAVSGRRLQNWGGTVHRRGLIPAPLPGWLQRIVSRISEETCIFGQGPEQQPLQANHVLVNSYEPGEGIMPHEDGPLYHPAVAILSLGAPAVLRFARKHQPGSEAARGGPQAETAAAALEAPPDSAARQAGDAAAASTGPAEDCPTAQGVPLAQLEASVICPPRSLLVFKDDAYTACLHGVMEAAEEPIDATVVNAEQCGVLPGSRLARGSERISLTVRRVLHTYSSLGLIRR